MAKTTLYLMLGYPGVGKTTTAEIIAKLTSAIHLSSDKMRLEMFPNPEFTPEEHQKLYDAIDRKTEDLLQTRHDVIYDANLNRYIHRKEKYDICRRTNSKAVLIWVQADKAVAKKRATLDGDGDHRRPYGNLDEATFERLVHEIEPPINNEPYIAVDGTKVSENYIKSLPDVLEATSVNHES